MLVFKKQVADRDEALKLERSIKNSKSRKTILRWINGSDNLIDAASWEYFS